MPFSASLRENAFYLPQRRKDAEKNRNANSFHVSFVLNINELRPLLPMTSLSTILSEQAAQITPQGTPVPHSERVYCVTFSPDGRYLVSGSVNRQVNVWEVGTTELSDYMRGHTKFVWSVAFSPDGKTLASASGDGTVFLWDIESRSHFRIEESHYAIVLPLYGVAYSPKGDYFAAGCLDGVIRLWSTTSRRPPWKLKGHKNEVYSVAFSPDGRFLASGGNDFTVRIWDVENKCEEEVLNHPGCRVSSVSFSPDGRLLAYASTNTHIYIINLATAESQTLSGHQGLVWSVAFSPDSRLLISGANDRSVRLWDVESGRQIQTLEGHQDDVNSVAFSPDGLLAASASDDRTVRVWDLSLLNERPETYLRLVADQEKETAIDKELLHFINTHRRSLDYALGPLSNPETSLRWLRSNLKSKNPPPLGLVHDLGLILTAGKSNFLTLNRNDSPYHHFLLELRSAPIIEKLKELKLNDHEIGRLIAQLLEGVEFRDSCPAPEDRPLVQSCRLLEAALLKNRPRTKSADKNQRQKDGDSPFLSPKDQDRVKRHLYNLTKSKIRFLKDLYATPNKSLNSDDLAEMIPLDSLPPALTDLYSQILTITPKLTFNDHRGSQTYSCGGYHGLTHKGALDSLALSEYLYPKTLLQDRILNREALYYGRDGEAEKRRRMILIITQSGLEMSGTANHLARAVTLATVTLLRNLDGDLRQSFCGSVWTTPTDPLSPAGRQKLFTWQDREGLDLKEPFTRLKEQLRTWQESYHRIDTLWIIDRHFAADQQSRSFKKTLKEISNLSHQRAWFIGLKPNPAALPAAADFFHHHQHIVMQNEKITIR